MSQTENILSVLNLITDNLDSYTNFLNATASLVLKKTSEITVSCVEDIMVIIEIRSNIKNLTLSFGDCVVFLNEKILKEKAKLKNVKNYSSAEFYNKLEYWLSLLQNLNNGILCNNMYIDKIFLFNEQLENLKLQIEKKISTQPYVEQKYVVNSYFDEITKEIINKSTKEIVKSVDEILKKYKYDSNNKAAIISTDILLQENIVKINQLLDNLGYEITLSDSDENTAILVKILASLSLLKDQFIEQVSKTNNNVVTIDNFEDIFYKLIENEDNDNIEIDASFVETKIKKLIIKINSEITNLEQESQSEILEIKKKSLYSTIIFLNGLLEDIKKIPVEELKSINAKIDLIEKIREKNVVMKERIDAMEEDINMIPINSVSETLNTINQAFNDIKKLDSISSALLRETIAEYKPINKIIIDNTLETLNSQEEIKKYLQEISKDVFDLKKGLMGVESGKRKSDDKFDTVKRTRIY